MKEEKFCVRCGQTEKDIRRDDYVMGCCPGWGAYFKRHSYTTQSELDEFEKNNKDLSIPFSKKINNHK